MGSNFTPATKLKPRWDSGGSSFGWLLITLLAGRLKSPTQPERVHVQARIGRSRAGVGHVLETIAQAPMTPYVPTQTAMTGQLKGASKESVPELLPAQNGGADANVQKQRP